MKKIAFQLLVVLGILLWGCSIDISPSTPTGDSASPTSAPASNGIQSAVNLKSLNLNGRLIYTSGKVNASQSGVSLDLSVQSLDLKTGEVTTIFNVAPGGWIDSATVSPDEKWLVISYQPSSDAVQSMYILPLDGSQPPQPLFDPGPGGDRYYQPRWSPDGMYVYFSHVNYQANTTYEIMRIKYPGGKPEKLADGAYWPNISGDASQLTYVSVDPTTGANSLFIANADGTNAREIEIPGSSSRRIIDAPIFSPDGESIFFSAPLPQQSFSPNWMDRLLGITVAYAHGSVPSEWWSVPITGGKPTQLTHVHLYGLYGSLSPDGKHLASFSTDGIFIMKTDGTEVIKVVDYVGGVLGTVDWIP